MISNQTLNISNTSFTIQQLEDGINQLNKEYADIRNDFQINYKPQINQTFKQLESKIKDQQQYQIYDPYALRNQNIVLFDKINKNKTKMNTVLQIQERAKKYLNDCTKTNQMLNSKLQELQNQLQRAQYNHQSANQLFEKQKKSIEEQCCSYKRDEEYVRIQNLITKLNEQSQIAARDCELANTYIRNGNQNIENLKIEKEETVRMRKELDLEKEEINNKINELKQLKINGQKQKESQIKFLQEQIKDLESNKQEFNKPTLVYYLFDENDLSPLEDNYMKYCNQARIKSNNFNYSSGKGKLFGSYSFTKCLETITEQLEKIKVSQTQNNAQILIKLIVNSVTYQSYQSHEQKINLLIEKVTQIIKSGYELKIHIFDKNCVDKMCFYYLYTKLEKITNVIYQNLLTCTNQEGLESNRYPYDVDRKKKFQIMNLNLKLEQLVTDSQEQSKQLDAQISMLNQQLFEKDNQQLEIQQKLKNNQQRISELEQQVFQNQIELENKQTILSLKQRDITTQTKNLTTLESTLKTFEQKRYISSYQDQLDKAFNECEDLKSQISSLEMAQKNNEKQTENFKDLIKKLDNFYQGIQQEILVLYSFVYQFSGENDLLLLMFALSFDCQILFIDEDQEKSIQKVFGLTEQTAKTLLEYIQVKVERLESNKIDIILIPNHKEEIKLEKLNDIINLVQNKITERAKEIILKVAILNTKELMIQSLEKNIRRTN
ncbi:hypothetical protein TTHERM_00193300 (macronuclear) [Tetrahymena thermophila SB210]|uniref:Uncharacterized protein n=1 Tax=Tetrahymena thermophila (strain SB210) TaxID=312017 RepID=Q23KK5_TETTS|nr:hypothetical protein TTHERM_00193300 [Tetrahymena thermophila SB210]EAR96838.1 hypothetical protein TTHERM_00193300 [Tetrahymena thermophila SB210]|eukprot:XP_001017083.1 hypothetical protein TTHERM_00193300 [Tetrahymena thermophila SB210]